MNNVLITGGCGFLGRHLLQAIRDQFPDAQIKLLDKVNKTHADFDNLQIRLLSNRDITRIDTIRDDFQGIDTVIHCAGLVSFRLADKEKLYAVNVQGTKNVLQCAHAHGVKRFIHVSSVAALGYKDHKKRWVSEEFEFDWQLALSRNKHYMLSKHLADQAVKAYAEKMATVIVYPGFMFGPGDFSGSVNFVSSIRNKKIPLNFPGGTNVIDVRDVVQGIIRLLDTDETGKLLLSGYNLSLKAINAVIAKTVGVKPPRLTLPRFFNRLCYCLAYMIEKIKRDTKIPSDLIDSGFKFRYFDNARAFERIGWKPAIPLSQTISDIYRWMQESEIVSE